MDLAKSIETLRKMKKNYKNPYSFETNRMQEANEDYVFGYNKAIEDMIKVYKDNI